VFCAWCVCPCCTAKSWMFRDKHGVAYVMMRFEREFSFKVCAR